MRKAILFALFFMFSSLSALDIDDIKIPYQLYLLDNGLTLIVHEDHKAPVTAVSIWYHAGSKNDKPGKSGLAHLCEHLMFSGTKHFDEDYIDAYESIGASDVNAMTGRDRTAYYVTVPSSELDSVLWLESERMENLLDALTPEKLEHERKVVLSEKAEDDNEPYSAVTELVPENIYPAGHPYAHTIIGTADDIKDITLDDIREFYERYYGAANAVVSIAGDVDPEKVKEMVEHYFGHIEPGPPLRRNAVWIARMQSVKRQIVYDNVPSTRLYMTWNVPEWGTRELEYLHLVTDILASDRNSRLINRLVIRDELVQWVDAYYKSGEIGSQFRIVADVKQSVDIGQVDKAINEELDELISKGLAQDELEKAKSRYIAGFLRSFEQVGGSDGKANQIARNQLFRNNPEYQTTLLRFVKDASDDDIIKAAKKWLSEGVYILEVRPFPIYKAAENSVDRTKMPLLQPVQFASGFPKVESFDLANGLKVALARRDSLPLVSISLVIKGGYYADASFTPGLAKLMTRLLDEGTEKRSARQLASELAMTGSALDIFAVSDSIVVKINTISGSFTQAMEILSDVVMNTDFTEDDIGREKREQIDEIASEKATPKFNAMRLFPRLLYGDTSSFGFSMTGSGTAVSTQSITKSEIKNYYDSLFRPGRASLLIAGNANPEIVKKAAEQYFGEWKNGSTGTSLTPAGVILPQEKPTVYIFDDTSVVQPLIYAGMPIPADNAETDILTYSANELLGANYSSKLNHRLREELKMTYGAYSSISFLGPQKMIFVDAAVTLQQTAKAVEEIVRVIKDLGGDDEPNAGEVVALKTALRRRSPAQWETLDSISYAERTMLSKGLPLDYPATELQRIDTVNEENLAAHIKKIFIPENLRILIIGPKGEIIPAFEKSGFDIRVITENE